MNAYRASALLLSGLMLAGGAPEEAGIQQTRYREMMKRVKEMRRQSMPASTATVVNLAVPVKRQSVALAVQRQP